MFSARSFLLDSNTLLLNVCQLSYRTNKLPHFVFALLCFILLDLLSNLVTAECTIWFIRECKSKLSS